MNSYYNINNVEERLKREADRAIENDAELHALVSHLDGLETLPTVDELPIKHLKYVYHLGLYYLNKQWVLYALGNDPSLSDLKSFEDREAANYHTLNHWLGY
jgi:hypothetical protein